MSSLVITNSYRSPSQPVPFCDKNFKVGRFALDYVAAICVAVFYHVIGLPCFIMRCTFTECGKKAWNKYTTLISMQWGKISAILDKYFTYMKHKNEIIDFSENGGRRVDETLWENSGEDILSAKIKILQTIDDNEEEYKALQCLYGVETVDRWVRTVGIQNLGLLQRKKMLNGCCAGMSLEFISSYIQQLKAGKAPEESIKVIAPRFAYGASKLAQIAQIFESALIKQNGSRSDKSKEEIDRWYKEEKQRIAQIQPRNPMAIVNLMESYNARLIALLSELTARLEQKPILLNKSIGKAMGLEVEETGVRRFENPNPARKAAMQPAFKAFIENLPTGIYELTLSARFDKLSDHAICFIKTNSGKHFLFDPNYGTFALKPESAAAHLWKEVGEHGKVTFVPFKSDICNPS